MFVLMKSNRIKTPKERFEEIAPIRVNFALNTLDKLKRFAVRSNYKAEKHQLEAIITALRQKIDEIEVTYKTGKDKNDGFKLPKS
jgi:hypothetical protein